MSQFHLTPSGKKLVTYIPGDGIGPEVTGATRRIIEATGAAIEWEDREAGASVFKKGLPSGVPQDTIDSIMKTRVALKGPLETPVGFGEKSANVTLRKLFETYANIRPVRTLPGVPTVFSNRNIDLVVVRENVEDLYAGIEHMQTPGVAQCLKLISRKGCEKIVRMAFEFARSEGRKKVHCATKSNIMKLTEGTLKRTFEAIAPEYPDIEAIHIIVDNCAHQLVRFPENFDVIVMTNMNGDILSDMTSGLIGGLGFAPSANLGSDYAIFEAVHGSAPKYAGKNTINPTAVLFAGVMMLRHLGEFAAAAAIENSVIYTLEEGRFRTRDIAGDAGSCSTTQYTDAIIANLGMKPAKTYVREYQPIHLPQVSLAPDFVKVKTRRVAGVDVFVESNQTPTQIGQAAEAAAQGSPFVLHMVTSRGTKLYPGVSAVTDTVDQFRCRFVLADKAGDATDPQLLDLLARVGARFRWSHIEKLNEFDGQPGWTKAQGED
jgi:isocitrate dehydrogenase